MRGDLELHARELAADDILEIWDVNSRDSYHNMDFVIHFFFDDTCLAEDPFAAMGELVHSYDEALAIRLLVKALDKLLDRYKEPSYDWQYVAMREWDEVRRCAKVLHLIITLGKLQPR